MVVMDGYMEGASSDVIACIPDGMNVPQATLRDFAVLVPTSSCHACKKSVDHLDQHYTASTHRIQSLVGVEESSDNSAVELNHHRCTSTSPFLHKKKSF
jgi:hypothetical protein